MADDSVAEIVHDFFLKSCLLRPRLHRDSYACLWQSELGFTGRVNISPLSTGSIAEFYIKPMLSCVGDVDIMFHLSSQLAIPQGHIRLLHSYQTSFRTLFVSMKLLTVVSRGMCI